MRGRTRSLSLPRRVILDLMHASSGVPLITLRRTFDLAPLAVARERAAMRPGWAALFVKAFAVLAREEPILRTLFLRWPRPRLYELPQSVATIAIARREQGEACVLMHKIAAPDEQSLSALDAGIRTAQNAPAADVPLFRRVLRVARYPRPLRRLLWAYALNSARQRPQFFGSFGVTAIAAVADGTMDALSPGPYLLNYGRIRPSGRIEVVFRWDHRVTDGAEAARLLQRLEEVLNGPIAAELASPPV